MWNRVFQQDGYAPPIGFDLIILDDEAIPQDWDDPDFSFVPHDRRSVLIGEGDFQARQNSFGRKYYIHYYVISYFVSAYSLPYDHCLVVKTR